MPTNHHKYKNNYDYYRSIYLLNAVQFYDTGYASFLESNQLASPISVINYMKYSNNQVVVDWIKQNQPGIQCIVGDFTFTDVETVKFGNTQCPALTDYPDNVDIIQFLLAL